MLTNVCWHRWCSERWPMIYYLLALSFPFISKYEKYSTRIFNKFINLSYMVVPWINTKFYGIDFGLNIWNLFSPLVKFTIIYLHLNCSKFESSTYQNIQNLLIIDTCDKLLLRDEKTYNYQKILKYLSHSEDNM